MANMIMPQMGESIVEGTIVKWRKRVGENVQKDEIILEISTDKVDSEIPSPASGTLMEILAAEGTTIAVGSVIARIGSNDVSDAEKLPSALPTAQTPLVTMPSVLRSEQPKMFLSPLVKKMAQEHGLTPADLVSIKGSGANGRISKQDLLHFLATRKEPLETSEKILDVLSEDIAASYQVPVSSGMDDATTVPMDHVRKRIAEHMVMSKQTAPHVTSVAEVDVTRVVEFREKNKERFEKKEGISLSYTAFFVHAAAQAIREFPIINASVAGEQIIYKKGIHIGIAVGLDQGLIVPVIRNADRLSLVGLARAVADLATRARSKQLQPTEVQGGTFSITNIGTFGNLFGTPIINQPQVAILGTGSIKKRVVVLEQDAIAIRSMMYISLTYDHRLIDGLVAGSFLQRIVRNLENFKSDAE